MSSHRIFLSATLLMLLIAAVGVACSSQPEITTPRTPRPTPTINQLLAGAGSNRVTSVVDNADVNAIATTDISRPTRTPFPTPAPTMELPPPIAIYDDEVADGWTIKYSSMAYDLADSSNPYDGTSAIRLSPRVGNRALLFTLDRNARPVLEERVLGISFQLYSGEGGLAIDELAMAIIGSDSNTYWVKNDTSAVNVRNPNPAWLPEDDPISNLYAQNFSETTLGFMGVTRDIPPGVWVEAVNYLDERIYDPLYKNIVGFYFKTETTVRHDLLIDNVELIVLGSEAVP